MQNTSCDNCRCDGDLVNWFDRRLCAACLRSVNPRGLTEDQVRRLSFPRKRREPQIGELGYLPVDFRENTYVTKSQIAEERDWDDNQRAEEAEALEHLNPEPAVIDMVRAKIAESQEKAIKKAEAAHAKI